MVSAESAKVARKTRTFARDCDECAMPASPWDNFEFCYFLLYLFNNETPIGKDPKRDSEFPQYALTYPSIDSWRQCRAMATKSSSARAKEDPADSATSSGAIGSSLSTLVMSRCWLRDGMSISELLVFKE
jgi:hypothetical protein